LIRPSPPITGGFFCVKTGAVRVSGLSENGREIVLDYYCSGVWFGETSMLDGLERSHDAEARRSTTVRHLRQRLLLTALESY